MQEETENVETKLRQIEAKTIQVESDHAEKSSEQSSGTSEQVNQLNLNNNKVGGQGSMAIDAGVDLSSETENMDGISSDKTGFGDSVDNSDVKSSEDSGRSEVDEGLKGDSGSKVKKEDTTEAVIADTSCPAENENENLKF